MKVTGAQAIVKVLHELGTEVVFGYPGGQVIPLFDALYEAPFKTVLTAHEQGAVHAADGYTRSTGKVGVCIATSGPGATNIVTGIATAYLDSVAMVAITGQVAVNNLGRDSFQEIDIVGVTMPITKYNKLVRRVEDIVPTLRRAFAIAKEGRPGPVLVDIPSNLQVEQVEWQEAAVNKYRSARIQGADEALIQEAVDTINEAKQPVLLIGGGSVHSGSEAEVIEFAHKTGMPVVHTLMGVGVLPGWEKQCLGMCGMHGHIAANMAVSEADVLVVAGSRLSERVTGDRKRFLGKKTIIQLDIDPSEMDKNVFTSIALVGYMPTNMRELNAGVHKLELDAWWQKVRDWDKTEDRSVLNGEHLTAPWVIKQLNGEYQKNRNMIFVTDVGQNQMWTAQYLEIDWARNFLSSGGCGTMGFGLPASIGAKLARPDCQVVHIAGDGGFKMTGIELYTAVREKTPFVSIVFNNSCLGMVHQWQQVFYHQRYSSTELTPFDFAGMARACGADGTRVTTCEEFQKALAVGLKSDKPYVIEVVIGSSDLVLPMVAPGKTIDDFVEVNTK